jgi:hypothetical protein
LAAVLYCAGGGLIVDEVGLLLTFGNYWTNLTYTFLLVFLPFVFVLALFARYWQTILTDLKEFIGSKASIYFGVFLFALSVAFITETNNAFVMALGALTAVALVICVTYLLLRLRKASETKK